MEQNKPDANLPATTESTIAEPQLGRNELCPCGSGKKYKRCHGVGAAPKLTAPNPMKMGGGAPGMGPMGGFDPSMADPEMMKQMTSSLQRLPRAQLTKLQSIMQRAMAGQDVSRESAEFEKMLPPEFSQLAMQMMMAQNMAGGGAAAPAADMDADDAKKIVAQAVADGKMTADQAKELLGEDPAAVLERAEAEKKGISGFFKKITGN